jgi:hypothetical protein
MNEIKYIKIKERNGHTFTVDHENIVLLIIGKKVFIDNSKRKEKR